MAVRTKRFPVVGNMDSRLPTSLTVALSGIKDQILQDCELQLLTNDLSNSRTIYARGHEDFQVYVNTGSGPATAITPWTSKGTGYSAYARATPNSTIYTDLNGASTSRGAITGLGIHMTETDISGVANIIVISDAGSGRTWFYPDGGALTEITDANYPPKQGTPLPLTGPPVPLNGKMFVMTTKGRVYESNINTLATWGLNNYLTCQMRPDDGIGLARYKNNLVAFGKNSTEFLRDVGNPPPGSSLVSEGFINVGCIGQHAFVEWNDSVAFIGQTGTTGLGIYVLSGNSAQKISDDIIDSLLARLLSNANDMRLGVFQSTGRQYLGMHFPAADQLYTAGLIFIYHDQEKIWSRWTVADGVYKTAPMGYLNLLALASGGVYKNQQATQVEAAVQFANLDFGTRHRKVFTGVRVGGEFDTALDVLTLLYTLDDFATTSSRTLSITRPQSFRLGMCVTLGMRLTLATNALGRQGRMQWVDVDYEELAA